jgi:hypothetical protein
MNKLIKVCLHSNYSCCGRSYGHTAYGPFKEEELEEKRKLIQEAYNRGHPNSTASVWISNEIDSTYRLGNLEEDIKYLPST